MRHGSTGLSLRGDARVPKLFRQRNITYAQWSDWRWQQTHRLRTAADIEALWPLTDDEREACTRATLHFRMAITPYYLSLINPADIHDPVRLQSIPRLEELSIGRDEFEDPMAEEAHMPVPGLTHRYPDRALLYTTHNCPVYCRHCFRKRKVSDPSTATSHKQIDAAIKYIENTPEIRDVLLSGGDPLTFSDTRLDEMLGKLTAIPHVDIVRLSTRNPVTLPQRITPELVSLLRNHRPIYVQTHFNHLRECTDEAAQALGMLADAGCVLNNQMVLLKGVNDLKDPTMLREMNRWLLRQRCQPYYMFQCDSALGISHFRTPVASGLRIIEQLRGHVSGLAVPHYVIDLPGGGGKVSLQPNYVVRRDGRRWTMRNFQGKVFEYVEGEAPVSEDPDSP